MGLSDKQVSCGVVLVMLITGVKLVLIALSKPPLASHSKLPVLLPYFVRFSAYC